MNKYMWLNGPKYLVISVIIDDAVQVHLQQM
jgi:hypothetical protein